MTRTIWDRELCADVDRQGLGGRVGVVRAGQTEAWQESRGGEGLHCTCWS